VWRADGDYARTEFHADRHVMMGYEAAFAEADCQARLAAA
jgi:hypothetical protein